MQPMPQHTMSKHLWINDGGRDESRAGFATTTSVRSSPPSPSGDTAPDAAKPALRHISDALLEDLVARLEQLKAMSANPAAVQSNIAAVKEKIMLRGHASAVGRTIIQSDVIRAQRAIRHMQATQPSAGPARLLEQFRGMSVDDVPQAVLEGRVPPSNAAEAKAASEYQQMLEQEAELDPDHRPGGA